ncbi:flagellar biosynthesis GTPase FlhF [Chelatococcus caeni]|uniref:Flagellar biosynthesis GTPase FlhF n=1 Tax=Chelatococcus caeni TaxID=1348468 RepID=A0A840BV63_9HYPH|nr:hypothetical protein [Chelatococcus caeni]MBB4017341.1 flagellar biosynthesis GTPase FlhF [Chelatococcus caeni]
MTVAEAIDPRLGIGGNNPPDLRERLAEDHAQLRHEIEKIASRANGAPKEVKSDDDLVAVGEIIKDARELTKRVDRARVAEKEPFLQGGRDVDAFFKVFIERLDNIAKKLGDRATVYQREKAAEARRKAEEEARKLAEEAERQRQIAEREAERNRPTASAKHEDKAEDLAERAAQAEAAAAAKAADLTRVRSDTGTVASARAEWKGEIVSMDAIDLNALRPYLKRDHVQMALNTFVRMGGRKLAGAKIFEDVKASFR